MKNNKGQAFVEALMISPLIIISTYLIIRTGLFLILNIALDDLLEQALVCELQKKTNCIFNLEKEMKDLNFSEITIKHSTTDSYASIYLSATSGLKRKIIKQSELSLGLVE